MGEDRGLMTTVLVMLVAALLASGWTTRVWAGEARARDDGRNGFYVGSSITVGDRLRIAFYSGLGGADDSVGAKALKLSSLIERQDMTGEYVVQTDGTIFLPFLGKVEAAGRGEADLLSLLEKKAAEAFPGVSKVSVRTVEREPVYVTGDVPQPGAFRYSPGMLVMHVVALAGLRRDGPQTADIGSRLAVVQETERLRQSQLKMADLIAQRDVLIAARDARAPNPSEDLKKLIGTQEAAERITAAKRVADMESEELTVEQKALADGIAMLEGERYLLTQGMSEAEGSLKFHVSRFDRVSEMHNRGVMTDATYDIARSELDSSRSRWNDIMTALSRLEARILEVGGQKSKSLADAAIARERRINELQADIRQAMVVRSEMEPALGMHALGGTRRAEQLYRMLRRSGGGVERRNVAADDAVEPGDVVEVIRNVGGSASDGETKGGGREH
jgi:exopolysaccharide production protein ExoF